MRYTVRCHHCLGSSGQPLMLVDTIGPPEEAELRHHLRTAHPHVGNPQILDHLLKHFSLSTVDADG